MTWRAPVNLPASSTVVAWHYARSVLSGLAKPRICKHFPRVIAIQFLIGLVSSTAQAGEASADCLGVFPVQIVSEQTLANDGVRITARFDLARPLIDLSASLPARLRRLAAPGHLIEQRIANWQTYSYWRQSHLCLIQFHAATSATVSGLVSSIRLGANRSVINRAGERNSQQQAPHWWPVLRSPNYQRWRDPGYQVSTLGGLSGRGVTATRQLITKAVSRAGLSLSASFETPASANPSNEGAMLLFTSHTTELVVTLMPRRSGTGVIAHLKEATK